MRHPKNKKEWNLQIIVVARIGEFLRQYFQMATFKCKNVKKSIF